MSALDADALPPDGPLLDCLIVGAGPAGLTAATYLARFHREFLVVDGGKSRARWIPESHNCPGFPFGVGGPELLTKLHAQATGYGACIEQGHIARLERNDDGFLATADDGRRWRARFVVLATGVVDVMPAMDGLQAGIESHAVRLCAVCDGYEASDHRIAVVAPVDDAIRHALFLRSFSRNVTVVRSEPGEPSEECARLAREAGVTVLGTAKSMRCEGNTCVVETESGEHHFDTLYPVLGSNAQSDLARAFGAELDDNSELVVDAHMLTSVDGLYAIGDVVSALNQISVAVGHAAIAATAIHNRLPRNWRELQPD
ncbi:MAG: NAD(P)/FAD-dependent oxidoreductase [Thermomonas sp.]